MSAFKTLTMGARSLSAAATASARNQVLCSIPAVATRPLTLLSHSAMPHNHNNHSRDKKGFATSLPYADFSKQDGALDKAQQYMDEGVSFQSNNMLPLAMSSFQRSLNERPTAAAHYNMGVCYFQLGDFQSSIQSFQESLKLSPHHADVHTNIATAHIKLNNDLKAALSHLQAAANIAPTDGEIQFNLGVISEQTGDFDGAIKAYKAAVDVGVENASIHLRNVSTKKFAKLANDAKEADFKESK